MKTKVFCIGFHKTGTSSLNLALTRLGYKVKSTFGVSDPNISENVYFEAKNNVMKFDAFEDNPWPIIYKELDAWVPGSKFILTYRSADSWYRSASKHFGSDTSPMREWIYGAGSPEGNEDIYKSRYEKHNQDVLAFFKNRPDDLLVMELGSDFNWETLCSFLDEPIPKSDFPRTNTSGQRVRSKLLRFSFVRIVLNFLRKRSG